MKYYCEAFSKEYVNQTKLIFRNNNHEWESYSWQSKDWKKNSDIGRRYWDGSIDYVEITEEKAKELISNVK